MTHHWTHLGVADQDSDPVKEADKPEEQRSFVEVSMDADEAVKILEEFCDELELGTEELLLAGDRFASHGEHHTLDVQTPDIVWEKRDLYWEAWSVLRQRPIPSSRYNDSLEAPFTCSC